MVLEELCLQGCKELTDYSVEVLVKHQPALQRLDISACTELTSRSVEAVARGLRTLTHLSLSRDWRITEKGARGLNFEGCHGGARSILKEKAKAVCSVLLVKALMTALSW